MSEQISKAEQIRQLLKDHSIADVSKMLNIRYQYVYQISQTVSFAVKKSDRRKISVELTNSDNETEVVSRAEAIRRMYLSSIAIADIARELNTSYQIVYQTLKNSNLLHKK